MTNLRALPPAQVDHTRAHRVEIGNFANSPDSVYHIETPVGRVYATTTGRAVLPSALGPIIMTEAECLELERALRLASRTLDKWERHKRREDVRQIVIVNGVATMRYEGFELVLRKQPTRVTHKCDECRRDIAPGASWINVRTPGLGGTVFRQAMWRICDECFPKLIVDQAKKVEAVK